MAKIEVIDIRMGAGVYRIQAVTIAGDIARYYAGTYGTDYEREHNNAIRDDGILIDWLQHRMTLQSAGAVCLVRSRRGSGAGDLVDAEIIDVTCREEIPA